MKKMEEVRNLVDQKNLPAVEENIIEYTCVNNQGAN